MKSDDICLRESTRFLNAFAQIRPRNFMSHLLRRNYATAILTHHPRAASIDSGEIQRKADNLIDCLWASVESCQSRPADLFSVLRRLSRSATPQSACWFPEFCEAYDHYKHHTKLPRRMSQLHDLIPGPSFCDIGCGGGDWLLYAKHHHDSIREAVGIDTLDWRSEEVAGEIDFLPLDFSDPKTVSPRLFDSATCLAVLHHVPPERITVFLRGIATALRPGGWLVVEEDTLLDESDLRHPLLPRHAIQPLLEEQPFFEEYLSMPPEQQLAVLIMIDLLGNSLSVGVPDMPFPFGFRHLSDWVNLFTTSGFHVRQIIPAGFVAGNFNQSVHVFFQMERLH